MEPLSLQQIAKALGGQITGDRVRAPGPGHSPRDRSLWVRLAPDHPDGFIAGSMSPRDGDWRACKEYVRDRIGLPRWSPNNAQPVRRASVDLTLRERKEERSAKALELWRASTTPRKEVETYLREVRGYAGEIPVSLRQGSTLQLGRIPVPTLIAAVSGPDRRVMAVQETKLTWTGQKANCRVPRLTYGSLSDGAVRLYRAGETLGLAEGVEDALAVSELFQTPCWATLGAYRFQLVQIPPEVRRVIIFADNDDASLQASERARERFTREGLAVEIRAPSGEGEDWNDVLVRQKREGLK